MFNSIGDYFAGVKRDEEGFMVQKNAWSTFVVGIFSIIVALFLFIVDFGLTEAMSMIMGVK